MIFPLDGAVRHALTIDPTVWIFDERKRNVEALDSELESDQDAYYAKMGKAWDEGLTQGARIDHNKPMSRADKDAALRDSFAMPFAPFLQNAEPLTTATHVSFYGETTLTLSLAEARTVYLQFSKDGKVLTDGPVYVLYDNQCIRSVDHIVVRSNG
ncbi:MULTISPECIES: hypothetical protein [Exiguobacterium]|uniref:hypothetical protein n=1 Tax=Exiguobacterium TaxID=33986 RepID=UPI001BA48186|nr:MULTISPECIES: hypothetical protein [Exiguobacterium]QUE85760.1 hypothetical protein KB235_11415 [Exiguobacterium alkaliphilum]